MAPDDGIDAGMAGASEREPEHEDAFLDVLAEAGALAELPDLARVDAWVSSALGVWAEAPDRTVIDNEFADWLAASKHPAAPLTLLGLQRLSPVAGEHVAAARVRLIDPPPWVDQSDLVVPTRAWEVTEADAISVGIGFALADGSEHSLLADIVDGRLTGLVAAPGPDELFDGAEDVVNPAVLGVGRAAELIVSAWRATIHAAQQLPDTVHVNAALARARLGLLVDGFDPDPPSGPAERPDETGIDPDERVELNLWALSVLDGAGVGAGQGPVNALVDPLRPQRWVAYPDAEREAFAALEWADWLGAVLGLVRGGREAPVSPERLVDEINRCPEVTSTIPRRDRPYFEWAFSLVLVLWQQQGVVESDGTLTPDGLDRVVAALREAWSA